MDINQLFQQIINHPLPSALVVLNLIIIESLLSLDNAAVLATMVLDLPKESRSKALKYGIFGAYIFRGLALLFAALLVQFWFLKPLGGLYLIYLTYNWWQSKKSTPLEAEVIEKKEKWLYRKTIGLLGNFWSTVLLVELMDMAFSVDNVFAAVAFSDNIILIWLGVFIGILAMRFIAQLFLNLMERYSFLETCAYTVIGLLGIKLSLSLIEHFFPTSITSKYLGSHEADWITSALTVGIFVIPILTSSIFGYPSSNKKEAL